MFGVDDVVILKSFLHGLLMGFSLIVVIGAQNSFVLKQGLRQQYIFWVCLICALSDAVLIAFGVMGFGTVILQYPMLTTFATYAGALFLFIYGAIHFKHAFLGNQSMRLEDSQNSSVWKACLICIALTWLNPHVYLDTVVLLGSISVKFGEFKHYFAFGAMTASVLFFFSLGYGAKYLLPIFKNPKAWRILDVVIAIIMWLIAISLIFG